MSGLRSEMRIEKITSQCFYKMMRLIYIFSPPVLISLSVSLCRSRFSIDPTSDQEMIFRINPETGAITLGKVLDRETAGWHNITVKAVEAGRPPLHCCMQKNVHEKEVNSCVSMTRLHRNLNITSVCYVWMEEEICNNHSRQPTNGNKWNKFEFL